MPRVAYTVGKERYNHICASAVDSWYTYEELEARQKLERATKPYFDAPMYEKKGLKWVEEVDKYRRTKYIVVKK